MLYGYQCTACNTEWEVIKPVAEIDSPETCEKCGALGKRQISGGQHIIGAKVQDPYFSHALGEVVKNDAHARKIAKQKGMIEIGNESQTHLKPTLHKYDF